MAHSFYMPWIIFMFNSQGDVYLQKRSEWKDIQPGIWETYFKAICIKERMNPKKQLSDMPRRYWKYMTEKN